MTKLHSDIKDSYLIRVGKKETISTWWDNKYLAFSCAANWIDYAKTDKIFGDPYESVFARVAHSKPVFAYDVHGKAITKNIQRFPDQEYPSCDFLRFVPTILIPAICFYYMHRSSDNPPICARDEHGNQRFNLDLYAEMMGIDQDKAGFLILDCCDDFLKELQEQIPKALKENQSNLTQERFYPTQSTTDDVYWAKPIDYKKHKRTDEFCEYPTVPEELFWKFSDYEKQAEARFIIPHWNFRQELDLSKPETYNAKQNYLNIKLPHLKDYGNLFVPSENRREGKMWLP